MLTPDNLFRLLTAAKLHKGHPHIDNPKVLTCLGCNFISLAHPRAIISLVEELVAFRRMLCSCGAVEGLREDHIRGCEGSRMVTPSPPPSANRTPTLIDLSDLSAMPW